MCVSREYDRILDHVVKAIIKSREQAAADALARSQISDPDVTRRVSFFFFFFFFNLLV
jgi:hypothetical protein